MPLVRIKRFGNQFASCGIAIRPPENRAYEPGIKRLCPKLVPGQVVELPENHNALNQECIEVVKKVRDDEILRPWVYRNAEHALQGNPFKAKFSPDDIAEGLAMAKGAVDNADKYREKARVKAERKADAETYDDDGDDDGEELVDDDGEEVIDDSDDANARRASNRETADVYKGAKPVTRSVSKVQDDPEPPAPPQPSQRRRRARASARDE